MGVTRLSSSALTWLYISYTSRWIDSERDEALLSKGIRDDTPVEGSTVRHNREAWLAFGSGPRVCPGQVSVSYGTRLLVFFFTAH